MKISEVIRELEAIKSRKGDLDVICMVNEICWSSGALVGSTLSDVTKIEASSKTVHIKGDNKEV